MSSSKNILSGMFGRQCLHIYKYCIYIYCKYISLSISFTFIRGMSWLEHCHPQSKILTLCNRTVEIFMQARTDLSVYSLVTTATGFQFMYEAGASNQLILPDGQPADNGVLSGTPIFIWFLEII